MTKIATYPVIAAALLFGTATAFAQTSTNTQTGPKAPTTTTTQSAQPKSSSNATITLTADQAKSWVDKPIYSSDNKQIGEVVGFERGSDNTVKELHADIGGMMGLGETRVKLMPQQFKLQGDRVQLNMTQEQAKSLPKV